jgi:FkbM family methyltransferase
VAPSNPNEVPDDRLRPRLLDDREEAEAYLEAFDTRRYGVATAPGWTRFYVDPPPDRIKDELRAGRMWEAEVARLLLQHTRPGSTAIDAGAHIGTHTLTLARAVGPLGRVYAFEPQRKLHRELVHNMRLNQVDNVVALRFALGDEPGVIEMRAPVEGNEGGTPVDKGGEKAELRTLDSFGFSNVSMLKIDVEGFEDAVLDGAKETIERSKPVILIEILGGHRYATATSEQRARIDGTRRRLKALGYRVEQVSAHDYLAIHDSAWEQIRRGTEVPKLPGMGGD